MKQLLIIRRTSVILALMLLTATSATVSFGQINKSERPKKGSSSPGQVGKVQPFDDLIGLNADGTKAALYRHRKEIAIVDLSSGQIEQTLPLTSEQISVFGTLENGPSKKNYKMKAFFTSDQRFLWIFSIPSPMRMMANFALLPPEMKALFGAESAPKAFLGKWDLRTAELVDQVDLNNREIFDCELIAGNSSDVFCVVEQQRIKGEYVKELDYHLERSEFFLRAYDQNFNRKLREQKLSVFGEGGAISSVGGHLMVRSSKLQLLNPATFSTNLTVELDSLGSNFPEISFDSADSLFLYSPDFWWPNVSRERSEYGLPFSKMLKLIQLDVKTAGRLRAVSIATNDKWANPQIGAVSRDSANANTALAEWSEVWNNQPAVAILTGVPGAWVIKNDSNQALSKSIGSFYRFDGTKAESKVFDGRYLGVGRLGLIFSTGLWSTKDSKFLEYKETSKSRTINAPKESDQVQVSALVVGASQNKILAWTSEGIVCTTDKDRSLTGSSWQTDSIRIAMRLQGSEEIQVEKTVGAYLEEQDHWIVAIPYRPANSESETKRIKEEFEAIRRSTLLEYAKEVRERLNKPTSTDDIDTAMAHLVGNDWALLQLNKSGSAQLLRTFRNSIQVLVSAKEKHLVLAEITASPRSITVHELFGSGTWTSLPIELPKNQDLPSVLDYLVKQAIDEEASRSLASDGQSGVSLELFMQKLYVQATASPRYSINSSAAGINLVCSDGVVLPDGELRFVSIVGGIPATKKVFFNEYFISKFSQSYRRLPVGSSRAATYAINTLTAPIAVATSTVSGHIASVFSDHDKLTQTFRMSESLYIDLRSTESLDKRQRLIAIGKHLKAGEVIQSIELSPDAQLVALKSKLQNQNICRVVQINTNKVVATSTEESPIVFTPNSKIVLGSRIADTDRLLAEGDSAFEPILQ